MIVVVETTLGERTTVISCNMKLWREALNASSGWRKKLATFKSYMEAKLASFQKISYVAGQQWMINHPGNTLWFFSFPLFPAFLSPHVAGPTDQTIQSICGSTKQIPGIWRSTNGFERKNLIAWRKTGGVVPKKEPPFLHFPLKLWFGHIRWISTFCGEKPQFGSFLWKIKLDLKFEILSCLFPDFIFLTCYSNAHTHTCIYIYIVHSLLLSDSLTLHRRHPQTRPYASVFVLFLSENQIFVGVVQQRKTGCREDT